MDVSEFDFELPKHLIAQAPAKPRDSGRLLHVHSSLSDWTIKDLPNLLERGDMLVFNNTKVLPTRLAGKRGNASIDVTIHKPCESDHWWSFARPGRKLKIGDIITFSEEFYATVKAKEEDGDILLSFNETRENLTEALNKYGSMPLPPYIKRPRGGLKEDFEHYQTVFASNPGAVAAPTAGLHFTDKLLSTLTSKGIELAFITLHIGAGTFLPVKVNDTKFHNMHPEWGEIEESTAEKINIVKNAGGKIIPVGTTVLRLLETAADKNGVIDKYSGQTDLFITPGYQFKISDQLITNFHLPKSTLFMLVSAFSGLDQIKLAYAHAIEKKYRFFSYGDACLLNNTRT